jgi:hypothetical protein
MKSSEFRSRVGRWAEDRHIDDISSGVSRERDWYVLEWQHEQGIRQIQLTLVTTEKVAVHYRAFPVSAGEDLRGVLCSGPVYWDVQEHLLSDLDRIKQETEQLDLSKPDPVYGYVPTIDIGTVKGFRFR